MTETTKKRRRLKTPAILPRLVILFFLIMVVLFINMDSVSHMMNRHSYEEVTATVVKPATDDLLLVVPMVELQYQYQGEEYTGKKYFLVQPFFGLSRDAGTELTVYVNTYAPNYCLFKENFFRNIANWILLALIVVCIGNMVRRIQKWRIDRRLGKEGAQHEE